MTTIDIIQFSKNKANNLCNYFVDRLLEKQDTTPKLFIRNTTFGYVPNKDLINHINFLNTNRDCHGIIIVGPYPKYLDKELIMKSIKPSKDLMFNTDAYLSFYKQIEEIKELRDFIAPHDPISYSVITNIKKYMFREFKYVGDFKDTVFTKEEEQQSDKEYRPFRKVAIYGSRNNVHCKYLAVSLMKRGISDLVFVNDKNMDEISKSSIVILMASKLGLVDPNSIKEGTIVFDNTFSERKKGVLYGALSNYYDTHHFTLFTPKAQMEAVIDQIAENAFSSCCYETSLDGEYGKTGVIVIPKKK